MLELNIKHNQFLPVLYFNFFIKIMPIWFVFYVAEGRHLTTQLKIIIIDLHLRQLHLESLSLSKLFKI